MMDTTRVPSRLDSRCPQRETRRADHIWAALGANLILLVLLRPTAGEAQQASSRLAPIASNQSEDALVSGNPIQAVSTARMGSHQKRETFPNESEDSQPEIRGFRVDGAPETAASASFDANDSASLGTNQLNGNNPSPGLKLQIFHLITPGATLNGTQNVTLDCMFAFDKKLDRRLTIKWFFNDQVEPIYQWIPELNKRVYSDDYERFVDKTYEVSEDTDFMLQAYKWVRQQQQLAGLSSSSASSGESGGGGGGLEEVSAAEPPTEEEPAVRHLLAGRLNKLARLGGRKSSQLLETLRAALFLEDLQFNRFRALRLIRPTTELSGMYTCSVSSLDSDNSQTSQLIIYEPAKALSFNATKTPNGQQYNLSCAASQVFPRPRLSLFRYRAALVGSAGAGEQQAGAAGNRYQQLAATSLRQEPLNPVHGFVGLSSKEDAYNVAAWTLVNESSLSGNVLTHFECLLTLDGAPEYEQRQALALQRGWHVSSAALSSRQSLVGLFSALASLLCLCLALVSSALVFKLLRRHAQGRLQAARKAGRQEPTGAKTISCVLGSGAQIGLPVAGSLGDTPAPSESPDDRNSATKRDPSGGCEPADSLYQIPGWRGANQRYSEPQHFAGPYGAEARPSTQPDAFTYVPREHYRQQRPLYC